MQELQGYSEDTAESLLVEQSESGETADTYQQECTLLHYHKFNVACETCIRCPAYDVMCRRQEQLSVSRKVNIMVYPMIIPYIYYAYIDLTLCLPCRQISRADQVQ